MIKSLFENWININIPPELIDDIFFAELEADLDELFVRRLQIEIWKKVYETIMNEIDFKITF